jgi:hypothetical protein
VQNAFGRFGGTSAILVGVLSILYAVFFLIIARSDAFIGGAGSWLILALSGIFSSAAYVAVYQRLKEKADGGYALWALLLGVIASYITLTHGAYEAQLLFAAQGASGADKTVLEAAIAMRSEMDPSGLSAFFIVGVVALLLNWLFLKTNAFPRNLAYLGLVNAVLLIVLFFATAGGINVLVLLSGGLTSVIAGPIWWIWLGRSLLNAST